MTKRFYTPALIFVVSTLSAFAQWAKVTSGTTHNFNAVQLLDSGVGYAVGDSETILKTTDAGATWTTLVSGTTRTLHGVYCFNDLELGDVTGDGVVDDADYEATKLHVGETTDASNFDEDLNADGRIDRNDARLVRRKNGSTLLP